MTSVRKLVLVPIDLWHDIMRGYPPAPHPNIKTVDILIKEPTSMNETPSQGVRGETQPGTPPLPYPPPSPQEGKGKKGVGKGKGERVRKRVGGEKRKRTWFPPGIPNIPHPPGQEKHEWIQL